MADRDRPIKIVFSDHGAYGEITWRGEDMPVKHIKLEISPNDEVDVTLTISARHCEITHDPSLTEGKYEVFPL